MAIGSLLISPFPATADGGPFVDLDRAYREVVRVAFLGLGQMGTPMAQRLLATDHTVTVWNRTPSRAEAFAAEGVAVAATPADASRATDVVITMLTDPSAVEDVLFGPDGVAAALMPGQTLIEMSTIGRALLGIRDRLDAGIRVLDAPVLGSVPQATAGSLRIFVGGDDTDVERVRVVLEPLGTVIHLGPLGAGASMKLVANSTIGAAISALGEALALADAFGLRREQVLEILSNSHVGPIASGKRANIESRSYPPNFKLSLARKDLELVRDEAERAGVDLRIAPGALAWLAQAEREGHGEEDYSAAVETIAPWQAADSP